MGAGPDRAAAGGAVAAVTTPNVVLILTDDQRWGTLGRYMPFVENELARKGVRFTQATVTNPLCCPSRASILTGRYSHNTGVWLNAGPLGGFAAFDDSQTLATSLSAAGYRTALIGKYLNRYEDDLTYVPPGWDSWVGHNWDFYDYDMSVDGVPVHRGGAEEDYATDVHAAQADEFIRTTPAEQPLFLFLSANAPHLPATPARRHLDILADEPLHRPPSYNEADVSDKPAYVRKTARWGASRRAEMDARRLDMLRSLRAVDDMVGRVLRALAETGRLRETLIVFTSDHGYHWGEHRRAEKNTPYEESVRVPFVVRYDALDRAAYASQALVQNIDLAPTIADLAGATLAAPVDGVSLRGLLEGTTTQGPRSWALLEHHHGGVPVVPTYCGLRRADWKYVLYADGFEELYNLRTDRYELRNVAADPALTETKATFRGLVEASCDTP